MADNDTTKTTIETSAEDKAILDSLSSQDMTINATSVQELCSSWNSKVNALDLNPESVVAAFKPLTNLGILENYVTGLSTAINSLITSLQSVTSTLVSSSSDHSDVEVNSYGTPTYSGNHSTNAGTNNDTTATTEVDNTDSDATLTPGTVDDETFVSDLIKEITYQDFLGLTTVLNKILKNNNITLSDLLKDENLIKEVKEQILSSSFLSDDLKNQIKLLDINGIVINLKNMHNNNMITTIEGEEFLGKYFDTVALENNTDRKTLFGEVNNKELVYNKLYYFNKAVQYIDGEASNSDFNSAIEAAYNGATVEIDEDSTYALRSVIDTVADLKGVSPEEFLKSCTSSDFDSARKSLSISANYINSETENIQGLLNAVLGGE